MTPFQLFLFIISAVVFYIFFKKLFSEDYPKRGIDFEANRDDEQIGGISRPDKIFSQPTVQPTRLEQLISMADESVQQDDMVEAKKALESAIIVDDSNIDVISRYAFVLNKMNDFVAAKEQYLKVIELNPQDDMAHASLANILHQLGEDDNAFIHHNKSIELDAEYAPHYYNYANTHYDREEYSAALKLYETAYSLDDELVEAKEMIDKLKSSESL
jgi:tetratricopeptide (TPR) repeat protein